MLRGHHTCKQESSCTGKRASPWYPWPMLYCFSCPTCPVLRLIPSPSCPQAWAFPVCAALGPGTTAPPGCPDPSATGTRVTRLHSPQRGKGWALPASPARTRCPLRSAHRAWARPRRRQCHSRSQGQQHPGQGQARGSDHDRDLQRHVLRIAGSSRRKGGKGKTRANAREPCFG